MSYEILFDFPTATNYPTWQIVNDDVMGGLSTSRFQILTNGGAVFTGVVSLETNGGFAQGLYAFVLRSVWRSIAAPQRLRRKLRRPIGWMLRGLQCD